MEEVNALKIRNNLGEILDRLNETGNPIFISKGRKSEKSISSNMILCMLYRPLSSKVNSSNLILLICFTFKISRVARNDKINAP